MAWSWHTKGRRIPTLIGKDVSGRRIPGGPYTGLQAVTAAAVPSLLWWTRGLWAAEMAGLAMFAVLVGVTVAAVKLVGKVDFASRNPVLLLGGYLRQAGRPATGTVAGRKLAQPKPHRIGCAIDVTHVSLDDVAAADRAAEPRQPRPVTVTPTPAATTLDPDTAHTGVGAVDPVAAEAAAAPLAHSSRQPAPAGAALRPAAVIAPDRRRTGLEAFLAGAAAVRDTPTEEDAA